MDCEYTPIARSNTTVGFIHTRNPSFYIPPMDSSPLYRSVSMMTLENYTYMDTLTGPKKGPIWAIFELFKTLYKETPIIAPLAGKLVQVLGFGIKAYFMLLRLVLFALALSPAICKVGLWWWRSPNILRSVRYGNNMRNFLDIYLPECARRALLSPTDDSAESDSCTKLPVIIYITGGAWIIGCKAWAAPLGDYLLRQDIIMVAVDYRNFPQGSISDMVVDATAAIRWTFDNIAELCGGDLNNVILVGQSAGAQIAAQVLLTTAGGKFGSHSIAKFVGVSGPFDMVELAPHFNKRGLYKRMLNSIMENDLFAYSPSRIISELKLSEIENLPPILLLHGDADQSVPYSSSVGFAKALKTAGAKDVNIKIWTNVTHSEPLVEGPANGNNFLGKEIALIAGINKTTILSTHSDHLASKCLIRCAKFVMPF